jgi:hypothetical protein
MKSGNLNFLEPSGPLQTCNGTALPLHLTSRIRVKNLVSKVVPQRLLYSAFFDSCIHLEDASDVVIPDLLCYFAVIPFGQFLSAEVHINKFV